MNLKSVLLISALAAAGASHAVVLTGWDFENLPTVVPATGVASDLGTVVGLASVNTGGTLSSPAGNGSVKSYSSNGWNQGEYFQFTTTTSGFKDLAISFDQTGSSTGPKNFALSYSTNGVSFTSLASYDVQLNGFDTTAGNFWNPTTAYSAYTYSFPLSSITALNNAASVTFRLTNTSTTSIGNGTVASGGTGRVDNVVISGTAVQSTPEPSAFAALGVGALALLRRRRKA